MKKNEKLTLDLVVETIEKYAKEKKKLLIISHRSPDGDTIGSAFALKIIYEALGGSAVCVCEKDAAPYLRFLYYKQESIVYTDDISYDKIIAVDVASPFQLGALVSLADKVDLMLDHHALGTVFADNYVDAEAAAVGEIIFKIYDRLRSKLGKLPEVAVRIFASITCDTGSFKYSNTTENTHITAGRLVFEMREAGIEPADISRVLHDSYTMDDLRAKQLGINNLKFLCSGKLAYIFITCDMINAEGIPEEATGSLVDIARSIEGVLVGVCIKQSADNSEEYKISSRSNCDINVADVCASFGGGGHVKAAGGRICAQNAETAEKTVIDKFRIAVERFTEGENE